MGKKAVTAKNWREGRRLRAYELSQQGWRQTAIAEALGVTKGAVSQWLKRAREEGPQALRARKASGRPPALPAQQRARLPALLAVGAEAYGFGGQVWTRGRVRTVIGRTFGVWYHQSHVGRILKAIGWTQQKPLERASQRDEEAIERWVKEDWPRIKKKPTTRGGR